MNGIEWAKALRRDPGGSSRDRAIGRHERDAVEHVGNACRIDLLDETGDTETPRNLRNGDDTRDDVGVRGNRRDQGTALPLPDDQLDQRRGVRIDDARNGLLVPPR